MDSSTLNATMPPGSTIVQTNVLRTEDDELPDYSLSHETSPAYDVDSFNQPLITYHLRATKEDVWHLVSFEPATSSTQSSYEITTNLALHEHYSIANLSSR
ncbi:hypothetical protein K458DRAFT_454227 [Lentithecium fluviatile CBS 122367]|uniref:Uncharacterized protein n=1 Tax=Lentithecium fluviatile CBS 122367 TaxID=1168545 RepID=A0A6G1IWK2_9PLEO|nr:hypothetical protein K458DRAFT_454227 [Lentithecium fluviatile CBS 122367]